MDDEEPKESPLNPTAMEELEDARNIKEKTNNLEMNAVDEIQEEALLVGEDEHLPTEEDVAIQIKGWMKNGTDSGAGITKKLYDNVVEHIELQLERPLSYLETAWIEKQYVITLLELWLEKSLEKAFQYMKNEENYINNMPTVLSQLDSIKSFEDIRSKLKGVESPLFNWCDGGCLYLHLILDEQKNLLTNTPRFTAFVNCYLKQFKTSCIKKVFSRCLSEIATNETHEMFIAKLNVFLSNIHEEKNLKDILLEKEQSLSHYVKEENKTGQDIIKQLVEMFKNSTETEEGAAGREWLKEFLSTAETLSKEEWPPQLQFLTKEMCKRFLLPETEIKFKEENGKQIISIEGVVIFVSKVKQKMVDLKMQLQHSCVQEIEIIGWKSVHIDCDLDKDTWHGINIGIITDKLVVIDDKCVWNVSGKTATNNSTRDNIGKVRQPGESGGNVHVVCNQIINGEKWTIVSDGGDGSANYKWTKEEFEKSFPSMSTDENREANMKTVLTTLQQILPKENRTEGIDISPEHTGNFMVTGRSEDGSDMTVIFYEDYRQKQTLILISGNHVGQGGYGGDITIECFGSSQVLMPLAGTDPLTNVRMGVYEASGSNGNIGKVSYDVAFIHKVPKGIFRVLSGSKDNSNNNGHFYGFGKDQIKIEMNLLGVDQVSKEKPNFYVEFEDKRYAELSIQDYDDNDLIILMVEAVKKNAVVRQSLIRYFDQIDEWKTFTECVQQMLSERDSKSINEIIKEIINEMENKVGQLHQRMTERQQRHQFETIEQEQYVKPAKDSSSHSVVKPEIIGRRPVFLKQLRKEMNRKSLIYCLEELPTEDGIDSVFHCLFGQLHKSRTKYVCNDTNKFRKMIAQHISDEDLNCKVHHNGIVKFVLRINSNDKHFPVASKRREELVGSFVVDDDEELFEQNDHTKNIKAQLLKEKQDKWENDKALKKEYAKYIELPTATLGLAELEILGKILRSKIHVYVDHLGSLSFQYKKTLNYNEDKDKIEYLHPIDNEYFIVYKGKGRWQRIEPNYNLELFFENFILKDDEPSSDPTYFSLLRSWMNQHKDILTNWDEVNTYLNKFNPKDTPDKLFHLVNEELKKLNITDVKKTNELVQAICCLEKWVDYYNTRNVSPLFYLHVVDKRTSDEWKFEFLLLEMETRLEKPWENKDERDNWRKLLRERFTSSPDQVLSLLTKVAMNKEDSDILLSLDINKLLRMLTAVYEVQKCDLIQGKVHHSGMMNDVLVDVFVLESFQRNVESIPVINEFYKQRSQFLEEKVKGWWEDSQIWGEKANEWLTKTETELKEEKKKEWVNLLLEMEHRNDMELLEKLTIKNIAKEIKNVFEKTIIPSARQDLNSQSRNVDSIICEMKIKYPNYKYELIKKIIEESKLKKTELKNKEHKSNKPWQFDLVLKKCKKNKGKKSHESIDESLCLRDDFMLKDFLGVFDYAVEKIMRFELRDTQRVAIMILLVHSMERARSGLHIYYFNANTLAQLSTGEGKSIIVAGVAIGFAFFKRKEQKKSSKNNQIDIITSNDVLALRDSSLSVQEGGLKELYEFFNVTVANNCSKFVDDRRMAYNKTVVYGQLANFQRDYLLDKFYNRNIRGDRPMDFVIIDEADCMLLDRGNNVLYLSHDIPGMEMLESLYVFIWEQIRKMSTKEMKSAVLYDLFGQITKDNLNSIHNPLGGKNLETDRSEMWEHLIAEEILDRQGRLLLHDVDEITEKKINCYVPTDETLKKKQLNSKIIFYLRTVIKRKRRIRIPDHLLAFVDRHLDTWLDNARRALELKQDEDYVIDCVRSDTSPDLNPQVIIIDPDTGTDQFNSQWDGALHQFLQLKEGCKLTLQSLKAIFISNANYITKYHTIAGVSGTLGSDKEQEFLKLKYKCNFVSIPSAFFNSFNLKPPKLLKTKESWLTAITEETQRTIVDENRSIVIFCQTIKQVNKVHQHLKTAIQVLRDNNKRIHRYTRDYEKFQFEKEPGLDVGNVIVATNLAGRGTDIKLSETLKANGGLHICITYFPENERVEEQAMGRAARKGEPGSGIIILCEPQIGKKESRADEECGVFVMKEERAWKEKQRISQMKKDFVHIEKLEQLFKLYNDSLSENQVNEKIKINKKNETVQLLNHAALFKVVHGNILDKWALWLDETEYNFKCFELKRMKFKIDINKLIVDIPNWMTPSSKVAVAKHLAMTKKTRKIDKAIAIFDEVIRSTDNFFYPAAFYYRAFIILTKYDLLGKTEFKKEKEEFIRRLRSAKTILNKQIDMQIFFIHTHQSIRKPNHSFIAVDGYKEQKQNNIAILEYFQRSIQWFLGSHCTISDLIELGEEPQKVPEGLKNGLNKIEKFILNEKIEEIKCLKNKIYPENAGKYFGKLIELKCIVCELNEPDTIPSNNAAIEKLTTSSNQTQANEARNTHRSEKIKQIAEDYGASDSLEDELVSIFKKALNEGQIEKELKQTKLIPCTRKAFWEKLKETRILIPLKECLKTNCVIISENHILEELENTFKLDREQAITLEFGVKSFDKTKSRICVLYNPTYDNQKQLATAKKIMFSKQYVKSKLLLNGYCKWKGNFESNKIAKVDLNELEKFKSSTQLGTEDFNQINIEQSEHQGIWDQLVQQKIINEDGFWKPDYDFRKDFNYPDCHVYAEAVMRLVSKKFAFELVIQQWLKFKENPNCLKAIHLLPRKPYRDMLADLMKAHVISGARVTEHFAINFKEKVKEITESEQERNCLIEYLTSRQSILTATKSITPEFFLGRIEGYIKSNHFASEFYVFRLAGLDRIIDIKDREWTNKRIFLASIFATLIVTGGLASIGVGGFLTISSILSFELSFELPFRLSKDLFFMGGSSDILYAVETILAKKDFTWADYGRQRIRSAMGKTEPIDAIKAIWNLSESSNKGFENAAVKTGHPWEKRQNSDVQYIPPSTSQTENSENAI